jgi:hypothetical protein
MMGSTTVSNPGRFSVSSDCGMQDENRNQANETAAWQTGQVPGNAPSWQMIRQMTAGGYHGAF